MKKSFLVLVILSLSFSLTNAQVSKDGWAVGLGVISPRLLGDIQVEDFNYGGQFSIQKNLSERTLFRIGIDYLMFKAKQKITNNSINFGWSVAYNFFPCEPISPYIGVGASGLYYTLTNPVVGIKNKTSLEFSGDFFFGCVVDLGEDFFYKAELGHHTITTDRFDGTSGVSGGGLFGDALDSYISINSGFLFYFDAGTKSTICDDMTGLSAKKENLVDYAKIEEIVRKYASTPANVDYNKIEDIVKKNTGGESIKERVITSERVVGSVSGSGNWVLIGVNFESGKSALSPESYPILVNAIQVLLSNPDIKVEIQGHTDNIGSESFNKKLSEQRAETVKRFLVAKGVTASRLSTVGVGSSNPVADNKTAEGRSLNRRIEFKVVGK
ncbi:MAG: OmpA family protein [Ignavibacteriaceae bacterium]